MKNLLTGDTITYLRDMVKGEEMNHADGKVNIYNKITPCQVGFHRC